VGARCYVQEAGGRPVAITPPEIRTDPWLPISPNGRFIAVMSPEGVPQLYPVAGGKPRAIPALEKGERPLRWGTTDEVLFVAQSNQLPLKVYRIDLTTGKRQLWREIMPSDPAGIIPLNWVLLTADGHTCVYNSIRLLSHLYLVDGLR
jgi:hypothetical protein